MRILYLIHGHERFSKGGAESAAFSLFNSVKKLPGCECWILCAFPSVNDTIPLGALQSVDKSGHEYIIGAQCEYFYLKSVDIASIKPALARLINEVKPDIIHLQFYPPETECQNCKRWTQFINIPEKYLKLTRGNCKKCKL